MDLSLFPTSAGECDKQRTGVRFTVRSANSPSYSLNRRPGVRKPRGFSEKAKESTEEVRERQGYATCTRTSGTNEEVEDRTVADYQAKSRSHSGVKGQCEEKETSGHKMSTKLIQNSIASKTMTEFGTDTSENCNPASESRGRTEWRRYNLPNRSKSLDWRTGKRSPDRGKKADLFVLSTKTGGGISKEAGCLEERRTRSEGVRGRVMSSVQAYNTASTSNDVQERNPLSQALSRASRGHSLPSRFRDRTVFREEATSFGSKGGQSILERIKKLYESASFGKTEDCNKIRDFSTPVSSCHKEITTDTLTSPQQRSYEKAAGGTFPRRFSSEQKSSLNPVQSRSSFTWTQKDASDSGASLSPETRRTREILSSGQWQRLTYGKYSEEREVNWSRGSEELGTRSLDRLKSRCTSAHQIRSARAAAGITAPPQSTNTFLEEERSRDRGASGSEDQGRVNHEEEKGETNGINKTQRERTRWFKEKEEEKETAVVGKEKNELRSSGIDEDVFESNLQKIKMNTIERKKFPEVLSFPCAASVKNKISQFEALTQRSQALATGQYLKPRRAFSVPAQHNRVHDGVKKSGSAKAIGGLRDKWDGLKEGVEGGEKTEEKATSSGKTLGSGRSLSVDEVGLRLGRKGQQGDALVENERIETDSSNNSAQDFYKYSSLKSTLEIPLNGGAQRQLRSVHIDETDFCKISSPEEPNKRPPSLLLVNSGDASIGAQKTTLSSSFNEDKTPTNTPNDSPFLSPSTQPENATPTADSENKSISVLTQAARTSKQDSPPLPYPLSTSSHSNPLELMLSEVNAACPNRKKCVLDLNAWSAGLNTKFKEWNNGEDNFEDDDESTQKDDDSNYDSDSGESSVTITSNMSQSDRRSFCVSLSDLCNFAGVDYESENDSDEWQSTGRSASLSSDMSALSCVSVLPSEELDRLLEDVRSLGDNNLKNYDDVQVVVLHKEVGAGLGFSLAGGVDQNKPVTVHKVFPSGVAAQEGSIQEGDQVLSINGTSLCGYVHWEALRVLRRAKARDLSVVVLRKGGVCTTCKGGTQTNNPGPTQTEFSETGQSVCVHLEKNSRDLGFSLQGGVGSSAENRPLTVQKIFQGGPVDKVCPGDEVLEIGGVSMVGMRRLEAWTLIRKLPPGPVDVVLRRPLKHPET
uniref:uncharacterized protein si:dkey-92i15.4 n=1 Tax=Scatophagus argus TaxID=75038 RepID=UPI001ED80D51|nr:uncharacterized protein si:dkey-92i15.4 [Scatophagus argus]XP_046256243.1 uncharacterized protein si:dkey-92i15.4 [Scatophagus argus]